MDRINSDGAFGEDGWIEFVGQVFVHQYYAVWNIGPEYLHLFYSHDASFAHDGIVAVTGRACICKRIQELQLHDRNINIRSFASLKSINAGILVQVFGEQVNNGQNSVFHYLDPKPVNEGVGFVIGAVCSSATEQKKQLGFTFLQDHDVSSVTVDIEVGAYVDVEEELSSADVSLRFFIGESTDDDADDDAPPSMEPEELTQGCSSAIAANINQVMMMPTVSPSKVITVVPAEAPPVLKSPERVIQHSPNLPPDIWRGDVWSAGVHLLYYPVAQQVFVGNLPHDVLVGDLWRLFADFGTVVGVHVSRSRSPDLPFCGFVGFAATETVHYLLGAVESGRKIRLGGAVLNIQRRDARMRGRFKHVNQHSRRMMQDGMSHC